MASKDSKRIVRTYNRVATALIEFEALWIQAWTRSIEAAKAGLMATLIVRHPTTGQIDSAVLMLSLVLSHTYIISGQDQYLCCRPSPFKFCAAG